MKWLENQPKNDFASFNDEKNQKIGWVSMKIGYIDPNLWNSFKNMNDVDKYFVFDKMTKKQFWC